MKHHMVDVKESPCFPGNYLVSLDGVATGVILSSRRMAEAVACIIRLAFKSENEPEEQLDELSVLREEMKKGREKYPNGCTVLSLLDEAGEVAHAVNKYESEDRVRAELIQVAAVAMRLYLGEIDRGLKQDGLSQNRAQNEEELKVEGRVSMWIECVDLLNKAKMDRYAFGSDYVNRAISAVLTSLEPLVKPKTP